MLKTVLLLCTLVLVSCTTQEQPKPNFACDLAKFGVDYMSAGLSARWECDASKVSAFLFKPINDRLCSREKSLITSICPMFIGVITSLGAQKVAQDFSCNAAKVKADFYYSEKICDLIGK